MTGVEIDPVHLDIAQRWFGVDDRSLVHADAIAWMRSRPRRQRYDLVVDDLFGHSAGEPIRAVALDEAWAGELADALTDDGLLVVNAVDGRELQRAAPVFSACGFRFGKRWSLPAYHNAIGVFSRAPLHTRDWSHRLDQIPLPAATRRQARTCQRQGLRGLDG